jgi:DNA-binding MarR family transcriptional regulator
VTTMKEKKNSRPANGPASCFSDLHTPQNLFDATVHSLHEVGKAYRRFISVHIAEELVEQDARMSPAAFSLLHQLTIEEHMNPSQLAVKLRMARPNVAGLIRSLQDLGYLTTTPDPRDRRKHTVSLSPQGIDYMIHIRGLLRGRMEEHFRNLTDDELHRLEKLSREVASLLEKAFGSE